MIARRDVVALRLPSPVSDGANRLATLRETDAVLFGPLVWQPAWQLDVEADPRKWRFVPLRQTGGYRATLAVRDEVAFPVPEDCR
jgi:hypothetical protein